MFAQRLRLARKKAGLSMRELATRMSPSVSGQAISKYEAGKMMPSSRVLVGLGQALDVSLDFLMGGQVQALEGIEFRKHSRTSAKDRARAEVLVTEQIENYLAIEHILDIEPPPDPFDGLRSDQVQGLEESEHLANRLRAEWNLGFGPIPSMTGLLESKGFKLIEADLPERFDGLACTVERVRGQPDTEAVVISSRTGIERRRLTLARELAQRVILGVAGIAIRREKALDRFAAALLVPRRTPAGAGWKQPSRHYVHRNGPPQARLRRFSGHHADPPTRSQRRVGSRARPRVSRLRTSLAQARTGAYRADSGPGRF